MGRRRHNQAKGESTVIGFGTVIGGDIVSESAIMRIDGEVKGGVNTKGDLIIGTRGIVRGDVFAANLNLGGEITGDTYVTYKVDIESTGKLTGDVTTHLLAIDEKAVLQGKVTMITEEPMVEEPAAKDKKKANKKEDLAKSEKAEDSKEETTKEEDSDKSDDK